MWNASQLTTSGLVSVALAGDYNNDGSVNAADYTVYRDLLGSAGTGLAADGSGDGFIDAADYDLWRTHYGQTAAGSGAAAIPEPVSATAAIAALLFGTLVRRRPLSTPTQPVAAPNPAECLSV